jgi:hypothetical protein
LRSPVRPSPACGPPDGTGALGPFPGLRTLQLPAAHAGAGTVLAHWAGNYVTDISRSPFDERHYSHATSCRTARLSQVQGGSRRMRPPRFLPSGYGGGVHVRPGFTWPDLCSIRIADGPEELAGAFDWIPVWQDVAHREFPELSDVEVAESVSAISCPDSGKALLRHPQRRQAWAPTRAFPRPRRARCARCARRGYTVRPQPCTVPPEARRNRSGYVKSWEEGGARRAAAERKQTGET